MWYELRLPFLLFRSSDFHTSLIRTIIFNLIFPPSLPSFSFPRTSFPASIIFLSILYSSFGTNYRVSTITSSWLFFNLGPGNGLRVSNRRDVYLTDKVTVFILILIINALKFDSNSAISTLLLFNTLVPTVTHYSSGLK